MTEPTVEKDPIDSAIAAMTSKLEEKLKSQEDKLDSFASNITREVKEIITPIKEENKSWLSDDEDDGAYVTKSDLKKTIRDAIYDVKNESKSVAKTVVEEFANKSSIDTQALRDHPEINTPQMMKEVELEMNSRMAGGRKPDDKYLLADSVMAVYNRAVRQGRIIPAHLAKKKNEEENAYEDNFFMDSAPPRRNDTISARTIEIARRMGMSEKRLREIQEIKRKN